MRRQRRRLTILAALAVSTAACASLPRLAKQQRWDEVVARAEARKRAPRRRAARAYAQALDATGRWEQARAVLLEDFRHGGEVASLVAAARIEQREGRVGTAAAHFGRAIDLDVRILKGDADACGLLRRRAAALAGLGAGAAAAADLDRAEAICPPPPDLAARQRQAALRADVVAARDAAADAIVAHNRCPRPDCAEPDVESRTQALRDALQQARAEGPAALRRAVVRHDVGLDTDEIVELLAADLHGELGAAVLGDDELRGWVGALSWSDLAPEVMSAPPAVSAYAQLRLEPVTDSPRAARPSRAASDTQKWTLSVIEDPATRDGWRLWAWQGDLVAAELELASKWRPAPAAAAPAGTGADAPSEPHHWVARVEATPESVPALLAVARLRYAAGSEDLALQLQRDILSRARAAGHPVADAAGAEVAWHLAWGRPWAALAVADAVGDETLQAAAASGVLLAAAFCNGPCRDDEDLELVTRVLDDAWVAAQTKLLSARALGERAPRADTPDDGCPTLIEVWGADAEGPVAAALATARASGLDAPASLSAYAAALESDLTLSCAGQWVLPLLAAAKGATTADAIVERLTQVGRDSPSADLQSRLAMISGRRRHAELMAVAAAGDSRDARATWAAIGDFAARTDRRALSRLAWREALMHTPALDDQAIRRALVLDRLADLGRPIPDDTAELVVVSVARDVMSHLADLAPSQRWAERQWLARQVVRAPWWQPALRDAVGTALWPEDRIAIAHPIARAWVTGDAPAVEPGPYDRARVAQWVAAGQPIPRVSQVLADPLELSDARLLIAQRGRDFGVRWRTALGAALVGDAPSRADGFAALLAMSEGEAEDRLRELLVRRPAALAPGEIGGAALGRAVVAAGLVDDPSWLLELAFGLRPEASPRMEVGP